MAEKGLVSAPNAAVGAPFQIGGQPPVGFYPVGDETGLSRVRAMADFDFDDLDALEKIAVNLFYGWGYNFYRLENQLRADDLTVRAKVGWLLGQARANVETAESAYRRAFICRRRRARKAAPGRRRGRGRADAGKDFARDRRAGGADSRAAGSRERRMTATLSTGGVDAAEASRMRHGAGGPGRDAAPNAGQKDGAWMVDKAATIREGLKAIEASLRSRQAALMV